MERGVRRRCLQAKRRDDQCNPHKDSSKGRSDYSSTHNWTGGMSYELLIINAPDVLNHQMRQKLRVRIDNHCLERSLSTLLCLGLSDQGWHAASKGPGLLWVSTHLLDVSTHTHLDKEKLLRKLELGYHISLTVYCNKIREGPGIEPQPDHWYDFAILLEFINMHFVPPLQHFYYDLNSIHSCSFELAWTILVF